MIIKRTTTADLSQLVPLFDGYMVFYKQKSDPIAYEKFLKTRMDRREAVIFLATTNDNKPMGFTLLYPSFSSVSQARTLVLNDLYVDPDYRRQGVAASLMAAAEEYGRGVGAVRLHLETGKDNFTAQDLYDKEGWQRETSVFYVKSL